MTEENQQLAPARELAQRVLDSLKKLALRNKGSAYALKIEPEEYALIGDHGVAQLRALRARPIVVLTAPPEVPRCVK